MSGDGLSPKQVFQKFPKALTQIRVGSTSENLLKELDGQFTLYFEQNKLLKNCVGL